MGGVGSGTGRVARHGLVEASETLEVGKILRRAMRCRSEARRAVLDPYADPSGSRWVRVLITGGFAETLEVLIEPDRLRWQEIPLTWTACRYRGQRAWFRCACGRTCGKLYRPVHAVRFACRRCHDLSYRSQRLSRADRLFWRATKLWRRITPNGTERPRRPKGMRRATYNRITGTAHALDAAAVSMALSGLHARYKTDTRVISCRAATAR